MLPDDPYPNAADDQRPSGEDDWHLTIDAHDFLAFAGDFLRSRPALHTTALTDLDKLRTRTPGDGEGPAVFGRLTSAGEVRAIFYLTPLGRLGLSALSAAQAGGLAALLADLGHAPAGVIADHDTSTAFAAAWRRHTTAAATPYWRTHLYRLGTLTPPRPGPAGHSHAAGERDREQVVRWCREFSVAVEETVSVEAIDAGRWSTSRFGDRHFTFWTDTEGKPVSMAAATPVIAGMVRIDPAYTPADLRGRGYAGAVTGAVSSAALAGGATDVVLFTDPRNPTSNALYQRLGFVRLADFTGFRFSYAARADAPSGP
ncbi:GNAT family N-acetyltransferase [Streptomyces sp. NPDC048566]|uniref:GNAT family N-acetyltransferase n=1 Tax=Streptomyces sp. NPDC048566 TaxID=3365569 RepID=UPI003717C74C